jgi:NAD(P)-dependent dehydrogenase (short-subunit alcohol dehydrogenase family)
MTRIALITGTSRGLGRTIATLLADEGWDLVLTARGRDALDEVAAKLGPRTGRVLAVAGDITDASHRRRLAEGAADLGGLDLLVNNASDLGPSPMPALASYPPDRLGEVYATNVLAPIALTQEVLPLLRARRGLVVNVTSDAAVEAYTGWGGYGSSKAALEHASRILAEELRGDGVGVAIVDPGDMRTDMHQAAFPGQDISDRPPPEVTVPFWAWLVEQEPLRVTARRFRAQGESWEMAS